MIRVVLVLMPALFQAETSKHTPRPQTPEDAIAKIPVSAGRIESTEEGLIIEVSYGERFALQLVSQDSLGVRETLWRSGGASGRPAQWCPLPNLDGETNLLMSFPEDDENGPRSGTVLSLSIPDGRVLHESYGEAAGDGFGRALSPTCDLDGDGLRDYLVGAPQLGADRERGSMPGYVSVRSGADGSELRRIDGTEWGPGFGWRISSLGPSRCAALVWSYSDAQGKGLALAIDSLNSLFPVANLGGLYGQAPDLDADGVMDFYQDSRANGLARHARGPAFHEDKNAADWDSTYVRDDVSFFSGATGKELFKLSYPDSPGNGVIVKRIDDLTGDGIGEIAILHPGFRCRPIDMTRQPLEVAVLLEQEPGGPGVGCAIVYSGASRRVVFGVWGAGRSIETVRDRDEDGHPDLLVGGEGETLLFSGPGRMR